MAEWLRPRVFIAENGLNIRQISLGSKSCPSIIVICFIFMIIVNNIPGMGRVFGGNLMGNWVSFLKIWEWVVTLQNREQKTPLVKLTVEMDGSLSWFDSIEDNLTQEKNKKRWNLLLEIDLVNIVYYQYWNL